MIGKYKLTRFARFIIFIALITPICYAAGPLVLDLNIEEAMDDFMRGFNETAGDNDSFDLNEVEELEEDIDDLKEEIRDIEDELNEKELLLNELISEMKEV